MVSHNDDYPEDHDPLIPAIMEAETMAGMVGDLSAKMVLQALMEHYLEGRTGELARLIEEHRSLLTEAML